uniref:Retrotransposon Copia-like N-terminal domain-containing protein n=1 Tax=Chenopodium quinoa TaxID=63459 RepID=A0A803LI92_CHEQI
MAATSSTPVTPNQDPTSVFYIHPSDMNSLQLVSTKFNGEGYADWRRSMTIALSAKNKLGFVDGTIPKPYPTHETYKAWERCNDMIISWILYNLDTIIARSVLYFNSAAEIWKDLEDIYGFTSGPQLYSLERQLSEVNQNTESIAAFFTKMKMLWDELNAASPLPFLMKLNEHYTSVRCNILMLNPLPNLSQAYRLLIQEERHKELSTMHMNGKGNQESMVFAERKKSNQQFQRNTNYRTRSQTNTRSGSSLFCNHCNRPGHSIDNCWKLHGYPANFKHNVWQKDKSVAAIAQQDTMMEDYNQNQDNQVSAPMISMNQYNQLLELLGKQTDVASSSQEEGDSDINAQANWQINFAYLLLLAPSQTALPLGRLRGGLYFLEEQKSEYLTTSSRNFAYSCNKSSWEKTRNIATKDAELWHLRMPLRSINFATPYSKLVKTAPKIDHLKPFGCLCFVSTSKVHMTKFDDRVVPAVFIGYPLHQNGYRVLELNTRRIKISRDVIFHETHFPFHLQSPNPTATPTIFLPKTTNPHTTFYDEPDIYSYQQHLDESIQDPPPLQRQPNPRENTIPVPVRQSTRPVKKPAWCKDFHCYSSVSGSDASHFCYVVIFGGSPISWKSKKQGTVSKSSSEAKYRAMSSATSEVTWLVRLLE